MLSPEAQALFEQAKRIVAGRASRLQLADITAIPQSWRTQSDELVRTRAQEYLPPEQFALDPSRLPDTARTEIGGTITYDVLSQAFDEREIVLPSKPNEVVHTMSIHALRDLNSTTRIIRYHTHPVSPPVPSPTDVENWILCAQASAHSWYQGIYSPNLDEIRWYTLQRV